MTMAIPVVDQASDAFQDIRPRIAIRKNRRPLWLIGIGVTFLALLLFNALEARRQKAAAPTIAAGRTERVNAPGPLPELYIPEDLSEGIAARRFLPRSEPRISQRIDLGERGPAPRGRGPAREESGAVPVPAAAYPPARVERLPSPGVRRPVENLPDGGDLSGGRVMASRLANPSTTIPQGVLIGAVLETALDSTRPGQARALVTRDVRGFDGTYVLIPRGSRLIGEYKAGLAPGQNRAQIQWTRIIRPDGVTIALDSPAADPLGRAGIKGKVNSHFFERFGGALINSTIDFGLDAASRAISGPSVVILPNRSGSASTPPDGKHADQADPQSAARHEGHRLCRARSRFLFGGRIMNGAVPSSEAVYLKSYLAPLGDHLAREDVTDLFINRTGEIWLETLGGSIEKRECPDLTPPVLERLARQIAAITHQAINREHPLLAATLPDGARVQIILPPATRGEAAMAIRKHNIADTRLSDYVEAGAFGRDIHDRSALDAKRDHALVTLYRGGDFGALLTKAVEQRRNILISGGTSSGKTTFLNALLGEVPANERLIFIEDTPELRLRHDNAIGLIASRSVIGEASVDTDDLLNASLRLRPSRIILGELRGREAFTFLRSVNTGHPGSMTTIHANSPAHAVEQLALMTLQAGAQLTRIDIVHYVKSTIDLFVQLERINGRRMVSDIMLADRIMIERTAGIVSAVDASARNES